MASLVTATFQRRAMLELLTAAIVGKKARIESDSRPTRLVQNGPLTALGTLPRKKITATSAARQAANVTASDTPAAARGTIALRARARTFVARARDVHAALLGSARRSRAFAQAAS